jgi:aminoglycoside 6'-N-acetyltransferase
VALWWKEPSSATTVEAKYGPRIDDPSSTAVFIVSVDGADIGLIQRYRLASHPEWERAVGVPDAAGIDYLIGDEALVGQGVGSAAIAVFTEQVLAAYPDVTSVVAVPQQANVASWRALEKAGYERVYAGEIESNDPSDAGPAYVYRFRRR